MSNDAPSSTAGDAVQFATVADVLADDVASGILHETDDDARSAHELADVLETSPPTVYRRLETIETADLVVVHLDADGFRIEVDRRRTMADRFTTISEDM